MPCRVDDHYEVGVPQSTYDALKVKANNLQRELCRTQRLVIDLAANLDLTSNAHPTALRNAVFRTKRMWKEHREKDKKRAVAEALQPFIAVQQVVQNIVELGGIPGPELTRRLEEASQRVTELRNSDALTTELY